MTVTEPWLTALSTPASVAAFTAEDWRQALFRWRRARVMELVAAMMPREAIADAPPAVVRQMESAVNEAGFFRDQCRTSLALLDRSLQAAGVRGVAIKGASHVAAGRLPGLGRAMDDIDLLVRPDDLPLVDRALEQGGWRESAELVVGERKLRLRYSHQLLTWSHRGGAMSIDLHVGVIGRASRGTRIREAIWRDAIWSDGSALGVTSLVDAALISAMHLSRTVDAGSALRDILDFHLLVAGMDEPRWQPLSERARELDCAGELIPMVRLSTAAFGTVREAAAPPPATRDELLPFLPPGPAGDSPAVARARRRTEIRALRHSALIRWAVGSRRIRDRLVAKFGPGKS